MFAGSFFSMFSNYRNFSYSLDALLDSSDVTLEKVLEEENVVSQISMQNAKLLDFLSRDKIEALFTFITIMPEEGASNSRCYNFPFISTEILCSDCPPLQDRIFADRELMKNFFDFLCGDGNITLAGYFSRVFQAFLNKRPDEFLQILSDLGYFVDLTKLIHLQSISELIIRLLLCEFRIESCFITERKQLLHQVLEDLSSEIPLKSQGASQVLSEMIFRFGEINSKANIIEIFISKEVMTKVIDLAFSNNPNHSSSSLGVIKSILYSPSSRELIYYRHTLFLKVLGASIHKFPEILDKKHMNIINTLQEPMETLGSDRLKTIEIILSLVKLESEYLNRMIYSSKVIENIVQLLWRLEWNSLYHVLFLQLSQSILLGKSFELKASLIKYSGFLGKMILNFRSSPRKVTYNPRVLPGYNGVLIRICNILVKLSGSSSEIQTLLNQYSQWRSFVDEVLIPLNYLENRELGGSSCLAEPEDLLLDENPDVVEDSPQGFDKDSSKVGTEDDNESDEKNLIHSNVEPTEETIKIQNPENCEIKEDNPEPDAQDMHWPDKPQDEPELQENEEEVKVPQTFRNEEEPEVKEQKDYEIEPEEIKIQNEAETAEEPREEIEEEPEDHNQNETPIVTQDENEEKSEKKTQDTDKEGLEIENEPENSEPNEKTVEDLVSNP